MNVELGATCVVDFVFVLSGPMAVTVGLLLKSGVRGALDFSTCEGGADVSSAARHSLSNWSIPRSIADSFFVNFPANRPSLSASGFRIETEDRVA